MPIGVMGATLGLGKVLGAGATAGKGIKLGASLKQGWTWLKNNGFSLTSGSWNLRKGRNATQAGFELSNAVGGLSTTTMLALAGAAYLLFKK